MSIQNLLEQFRKQFRHGTFQLNVNESINEVVRRENVPNDYGVYVISLPGDHPQKIVYIGKAGTIRQDGSFGEQKIRKRLKMKQDGIYRCIFFQRKMKESNLPLQFEWFVTFEEAVHLPPFHAESQLLAEYFGQFGCLPIWNREA